MCNMESRHLLNFKRPECARLHFSELQSQNFYRRACARNSLEECAVRSPDGRYPNCHCILYLEALSLQLEITRLKAWVSRSTRTTRISNEKEIACGSGISGKGTRGLKMGETTSSPPPHFIRNPLPPRLPNKTPKEGLILSSSTYVIACNDCNHVNWGKLHPEVDRIHPTCFHT